MEKQTVFVCEDSIEGIFTAVYEAWARRTDRKHLYICCRKYAEEANLTLFTEYIMIETDIQKAKKVSDTIQKKLGGDAFIAIYQAAATEDEQKAQLIFRVIEAGLNKCLKSDRSIMEDLGNDAVIQLFKLSKRVWNETHHYYGFVRFRELENGILYSEIEPKSDLLTLVAPHFAERLSGERWIISDKRRGRHAMHHPDTGWFITTDNLQIDGNIGFFCSGKRDGAAMEGFS